MIKTVAIPKNQTRLTWVVEVALELVLRLCRDASPVVAINQESMVMRTVPMEVGGRMSTADAELAVADLAYLATYMAFGIESEGFMALFKGHGGYAETESQGCK